MKKLIVSLALLIPILTGCADIDNRLTINNDKSASFVSSITYKGDLASTSDKYAQAISQNYKKYVDDSFNVEKTTSANLSTITATKKVKDLTNQDLDLGALGFDSKLESKKFVEIKKNFIVTSYNINMVYDYQKQAEKFEEPITTKKTSINPEYYHKFANPEDIETTNGDNDFLNNLDEATKEFTKKSLTKTTQKTETNKIEDLNLSFSIKVPSFASYNNADSVDGMIYTWEINENGPTEIKLQYVQYSGVATGIIILFGIILLVVLATRIARHESQKRIDNINNIV